MLSKCGDGDNGLESPIKLLCYWRIQMQMLLLSLTDNITYIGCLLHSSPNTARVIKSRRMRWAGHVARMGREEAYRVLVVKPEGKGPLGRPRCRWEDNNKMDL